MGKRKQIKVTETVSKELTGVAIAKYLLSIGPYKETGGDGEKLQQTINGLKVTPKKKKKWREKMKELDKKE